MSEQKVVIVTGASSGIGRAIALAFGREGHQVIVNYLSNANEAKEVVEEIAASGGQGHAVQADVSSFEASKNLVEETLKVFGRVAVLINNSGIAKDQLMLRMKEEDFDAVIDVNLKGTWNMVKHVTRPMLKQKSGRIINISSVVGQIGNPGQANYVASKAGVIGMTKTFAKEFGKKGITANAIAPGFIKTAMTDKLDDSIKEAYLRQIPLGTFGKAQDIANTALFLASDSARYISGQVIGVNGGMI